MTVRGIFDMKLAVSVLWLFKHVKTVDKDIIRTYNITFFEIPGYHVKNMKIHGYLPENC